MKRMMEVDEVDEAVEHEAQVQLAESHLVDH